MTDDQWERWQDRLKWLEYGLWIVLATVFVIVLVLAAVGYQ